MKPGVTIYFVRHGETDWNRARRYQGQADVPLNDFGRAQAHRNGDALRGLLPAIASADYFASPLQRTLETMRIIRSALGLDDTGFRVEPALVELNYGHWEGQLASDLPRTDPAGVEARAADPYHWRPHGGENYDDLTRRLSSWLAEVQRDSVVVSHGGVSRALRGLLVPSVREADVPSLDVPQDRVLVLREGTADWL